MSEPYIGEIRMFGGTFAPHGWMFCQGQLLAVNQYSALFAILGTLYGGNGQTTFGLPDLRGRSPVGMGNGPSLTPITQGEAAGSESVTILSAQMPAHVHALVGASASVAIPVNTTPGNSKTPSNANVLSMTNDTAAGAEVDIYNAGPGSTTLQPFNAGVTGNTAIAGASMPIGIRNPFLGINFIIATVGIFPPRN